MANNVSNVSFSGAGNPYALELDDIERRRALAQALQMQGQSPLPGTESVGGWAIPRSPMEGLGKVAQSAAGAYQQKALRDEEKALGQKYQTEMSDTLSRALRAGTGSPAQAAVAEPAPELGGGPGRPEMAAVAPDRGQMAQILMGHPGTAPMGMQQLGKDMEMQQRQALLASILKGGGAPGAAANAGGGSANPMAGMPPQIMALMTSGDPELVKLGTTMMEANKGIAQRPGAPVVNPFTGAVIAQPTPAVPPGVQLTVGPNGPTAALVPGAIQAMSGVTSAQAGAGEAGKAPYQLDTVNTPGAPTLMTRQQQIEAATGLPMPTPGQAPAPRPAAPPLLGPPPSAPKATGPYPPAPAGAEADRGRILQGELEAELKLPQTPERAANVAWMRKEIGKSAPGLQLQGQQEGAQEKAFGTERGQLEAAKPQQATAARTSLTNLERLNSIASELEKHEGLGSITGKVDQYSALDIKPSTRAARALQSSLVKQMATSSLAAMREASKTGGAVGAVTEKEWPILEQQLAAVDGAQSPQDYKVALQNLQNQMRGAMGRIRSAYQETYKEPLQFESVPYQSQGRSSEGKISGRRASDAPSSIRSQADAILSGNR